MQEKDTQKSPPTPHLPRHLVWSTCTIDQGDPFQRRWYIRQVLLHGRTADISALDLDEIAGLLDDLRLPPHLDRLWRAFLEQRAHG